MELRLSRIGISLLLVAALAGNAHAQTNRPHFGVRASYHVDAEEFGAGGQFSVPIGQYFEFYPSFDYFFVDPGSFWNANADLKYRIAPAQLDWLYVGAGVNVARSSAGTFEDTQAGLNLFAGAESLSGRIHPFSEFRFIIGDGSTALVAIGLNFTLGQH